jgi:hypothetical protein
MLAFTMGMLWECCAYAQCSDPRYEQAESLLAGNQRTELLELLRTILRETSETCALTRLALAEARFERWVEAEEHLRQALQQPDDAWVRQNLRRLQASLREVQRRLGSLQVRCGAPGASLRVDDHPVRLPMLQPMRLAVGTHQIRIEAPGHIAHEAAIEIAPEVESTTLLSVVLARETPSLHALLPAPLPPPRVFSPGAVPWVLVGFGAASTIAGVVLATTRSTSSDTLDALHTVSVVSVSVGATLIGAGITWLLVDRARAADHASVRVSLSVDPLRVIGVAGQF